MANKYSSLDRETLLLMLSGKEAHLQELTTEVKRLRGLKKFWKDEATCLRDDLTATNSRLWAAEQEVERWKELYANEGRKSQVLLEEHSRLKAEVERLQSDCEWDVDSGPEYEVWHAECGFSWEFTNDGPKENEVIYCPKCGGKVYIKES